MSTIWIIGDSTVDTNTPPFRGWGWALPQFVRDGVSVSNHAKSGSSTRSFRAEGRFAPIQEDMRSGDMLLIQFGHNDEKDAPELHTEPASSFPEFLRWYCDEAESRGAQPVLITPVSRRFFLSGCHNEMLYTHGEYPEAMRRVARERNVPLVDLKQKSRALYLSLGEDATAELFVRLAPGEHPDFPSGHDDKTHFNASGAMQIGKLVAEGLKDDPRTAKYLK